MSKELKPVTLPKMPLDLHRRMKSLAYRKQIYFGDLMIAAMEIVMKDPALKAEAVRIGLLKQ